MAEEVVHVRGALALQQHNLYERVLEELEDARGLAYAVHVERVDLALGEIELTAMHEAPGDVLLPKDDSSRSHDVALRVADLPFSVDPQRDVALRYVSDLQHDESRWNYDGKVAAALVVVWTVGDDAYYPFVHALHQMQISSWVMAHPPNLAFFWDRLKQVFRHCAPLPLEQPWQMMEQQLHLQCHRALRYQGDAGMVVGEDTQILGKASYCFLK